jgi:hypothetical protein
VLHTGALPPQSALPRQPTQMPVAVRQTGVAPPQAPALAAEHWPQAPEGWHAGVAPPHSPSPAHARHVCVVRLHTGAVPPQSALDTQATHDPATASQTGVAPPQRATFVAEHWPHAPVA